MRWYEYQVKSLYDECYYPPYTFPPDCPCLSVGPGESYYRVSSDIVVKVPVQYSPGHGGSPEVARDHLVLALRSMICIKREQEFWRRVESSSRPHPNIARRLPSSTPNCLFFERVRPIEEVWRLSTIKTRRTWVLQFLGALAWLEGFGYRHGDPAYWHVGVDKGGSLKLFNFYSVSRSEDELVRDDYEVVVGTIHYLLAGIRDMSMVVTETGQLDEEQTRRAKEAMRRGDGHVAEDAKDLESIIQDGWRRPATRTQTCFTELYSKVAAIFDGDGEGSREEEAADEEDQDWLQVEEADHFDCDAWLREHAQPRADWLPEEEYIAAWKENGYDVPWTDDAGISL